MTLNNGTTRLLDAVERLRPVLEEHAAWNEEHLRVSPAAYDAMFRAGLFSMLQPKAHGGLELHPGEAMRVWEAVARIDSAAAWNLVMNQANLAFVAWLPASGAAEVFRDGPTTVAGVLNPPGAAIRSDGGWRITGRYPFASGCHNATWLVIPAVEMDGEQPKVDPATGQPELFAAWLPRSEATILDTWHTMGMRGTGSTDISTEDVFVPDHRTATVAPLSSPAPGFEGPLFRMWPLTAVLGEATVSVGIAAAAVDAAVELCKTKTAAYNVTPLREQQLPQSLAGRALSRVNAARDTLYRATEDAYDHVDRSGELLSIDAKVRLQLAVFFAAEVSAEATRLVNDVAGASSFRAEQPFERHFRDAHVLLQHASKSSARYGSAGRLMFGLDNDRVWLGF